ncbi:lysophospholipid acyltransferase family protein [bacterium]|nr:lysophospholipid acyltransferase family protein [bacterium]
MHRRKRLPSENFPMPLYWRALTFVGTFIISVVMRLWFATVRLEVFGEEYEAKYNPPLTTPGIRASYATWHRDMVYLLYYFRRRLSGNKYRPAVIASRSKDGQWAAGLLHRFGIASPRGSSTRHGKEALAEYVELLSTGFNGALTLDAPKGPAQTCKMGALIASARAGSPLVCAGFSANPTWRLGSWDRMLIPKPFSRAVLVFDKEAVAVPDADDREAMERCRSVVQDRLNILTYQADRYILAPDRFATPYDVPVPDGYLGEGFHPLRRSINFMDAEGESLPGVSLERKKKSASANAPTPAPGREG